MPKFPEPPTVAALRRIGPELRVLQAGAVVWRIHFAGGPHPTAWNELRAFGPTDGRFDHHEPPPHTQRRRILYGAMLGRTCIAGVFQGARTIDRSDRAPFLVAFQLTRSVALMDLTHAWVTRAGASTAIHSGSRSRARRWSSAIYAAFPTIEGIAYCSSMDGNSPAYALYERAASSIPVSPIFNRALADPGLTRILNNAGKRFGFVVV